LCNTCPRDGHTIANDQMDQLLLLLCTAP